jgi:hypothetical protein
VFTAGVGRAYLMERSTDQSAAKTADRRGKVSKTEDDVRRQKEW